MAVAFSVCYSNGDHFVSRHFDDRKDAALLARKMSKQFNNEAYVHKCIGEWIGTTFSEDSVVTVAVYNNGKKS